MKNGKVATLMRVCSIAVWETIKYTVDTLILDLDKHYDGNDLNVMRQK